MCFPVWTKQEVQNQMGSGKKNVKVTSSEEDQQPTEQVEDTEADLESEAAAAVDDEVDAPAEELTEEEAHAQRVAELEDQLLRRSAEFENYKKRVARQYDSMVLSARERILGELLDIIDNFDRALSVDREASTEAAFREGTELIFSQMQDLLKKYEVTAIEAVGQTFDPNLHEALMQVDSDEFDEGVVALEINKGYRLSDRVLRHSKVGVSKGKAMDGNSSDESADDK